MNTKTITIYDEHITVTKHGDNDYEIYFTHADYSVRGTMLDVVQAFAEWQASSSLDDPAISFDWLDRTISNPWIDPSARFPLDWSQACETYGIENVMQFVIDACDLLRTDKKEV
mgnify:CR=1 FL=1